MSWFEDLTGVRETDGNAVREGLRLDGETLTSLANGRSFHVGPFEMVRLYSLRERAASVQDSGPMRVQEIVGDVRALHADPANAGALFQAASQFNMLEMVGPNVTPEAGIGGYENDRTQGPACAIACGAGTIFRNYFVPVDNQIGQTASVQLNGLAAFGRAVGNEEVRYWTTRNGYIVSEQTKLAALGRYLNGLDETARDALRATLAIGMQWDTEVTLEGGGHRVAQAYCSALPVGYGRMPQALWEPFARIVLEATYEATLCAARINALRTGNRSVFLTLVGGGVFGNDLAWVVDALVRACRLHARSGLDIAVVSYGGSDAYLAKRLAEEGWG